jgi:hypothetical protein
MDTSQDSGACHPDNVMAIRLEVCPRALGLVEECDVSRRESFSHAYVFGETNRYGSRNA